MTVCTMSNRNGSLIGGNLGRAGAVDPEKGVKSVTCPFLYTTDRAVLIAVLLCGTEWTAIEEKIVSSRPGYFNAPQNGYWLKRLANTGTVAIGYDRIR